MAYRVKCLSGRSELQPQNLHEKPGVVVGTGNPGTDRQRQEDPLEQGDTFFQEKTPEDSICI